MHFNLSVVALHASGFADFILSDRIVFAFTVEVVLENVADGFSSVMTLLCDLRPLIYRS